MYNLPNNYLFKAAVKVGWGRGGGGGGGEQSVYAHKVPPPNKSRGGRGTKPYTYEFAQLQCTLLTFTKHSLCLHCH